MNLSEKCEYNAEFYKTCMQYKTTFYDIFVSSEAPDVLMRNLKFGRRLFQLFPELSDMNEIFQDKRRNHSLFDHSLSVLHYTNEQSQYVATLIAAFMHDYGKIFTQREKFRNHDNVGIVKTEQFLHKYKVPKSIREDVAIILRHHTQASQYQRDPNWNDDTVRKFIRKTHPLTMEIIAVAKADKQASHNYLPYLEPYDELKERCLSEHRNGINIS